MPVILRWLMLFAAVGLLELARGEASAAERKPNILVIYSDDHGWADLGLHGADKDIRTPNLDQLARDGVRFTRGYVSAPQCVPSRAGLITGRYQQRFGVEDNGKGPLPLDERTIAERLKPAGYITGFIGKWHLDIGNRTNPGAKAGREFRAIPEHMPHKQGFDEYWRGELRQFFASHDLQGRPFADAPRLVQDNRFRVEVQTEAALSFLDRRVAKPTEPWFLYLAWYAPHVPLESPEPWFSRTPSHLPLARRQALAMIAAMDDGLGRLRARLRTMGAEKDTLIFFVGDNGAPLGNAWNGSLNLPMIGQKGMLSEGGLRTPFLGAWPGTLPAGTTYDQPVINLDIAATAAAAAGQPHDAKLDGVNLMPFLKGEQRKAPHDTLFWRWGSQAAVLEMPYKLIILGNRERLLFDITQPDGETATRNLMAKHPDVAKRLEEKLKTWAGTLKPPGLPTSLDAHHEGLFAEHDILPRTATTPKKSEAAGAVQGWLCRNGSLSVKDGKLVITPGKDLPKNARPFLTNNALDVAGPVTITLRVRANKGGPGIFSWRTKDEKEFTAANVANFDWPASRDGVTVKAEIPVKGRLIHLRITPAAGSEGLEVDSIELRGQNGETRTWSFAMPR